MASSVETQSTANHPYMCCIMYLMNPNKVTPQKMYPVHFFSLKYLLLHTSCAEPSRRVHFQPPVGRYCTDQSVPQSTARCEQVLAWWVLPDSMQGRGGPAWASPIHIALLGVRSPSTTCETHLGGGSKICYETINMHGFGWAGDEEQGGSWEAVTSGSVSVFLSLVQHFHV